MADDALKKAADMLIAGASMLREPCPYCNGVRVMKDGSALCASCGREPDKSVSVPETPEYVARGATQGDLESRLVELSRRLGEADEAAKGALFDEIAAVTEAIAKIRGAAAPDKK